MYVLRTFPTTLQITMNVLLTMVDVIRYVSTQYLVTGVTAMMDILLIMTISLVYVMLTVQREYICVCLNGFVDDRASGDQNISGSGNTVDCVGMLKNYTVCIEH